MSAEEVTDSWYLHSQGRRFGPLTEDEMRGYYRAGMVKAGDLITLPALPGTKTAAEVAEILGESPPVPARAVFSPIRIATNLPGGVASGGPNPADLPPMLMHPMYMERRSSVGWLVPVACILALAAALYLGLIALRKLQPSRIAQIPAGIDNAAIPEAAQPLAGAQQTGARPIPATAAVAVTDAAVAAGPIAGSTAVDAWLAKAEALNREANWTELLSHSQQWSVAEPLRDDPWIFLGVANERLNQDAQAIDALNRVLAAQPDHFEARSVLSDVYLKTGRFQEATVILQDLVRAAPSDPRLWNNLGNAFYGSANYRDSVSALEVAVKLDPGFLLAWRNLGNAYQRAGHSDLAAAAYAKADAAQ